MPPCQNPARCLKAAGAVGSSPAGGWSCLELMYSTRPGKWCDKVDPPLWGQWHRLHSLLVSCDARILFGCFGCKVASRFDVIKAHVCLFFRFGCVGNCCHCWSRRKSTAEIVKAVTWQTHDRLVKTAYELQSDVLMDYGTKPKKLLFSLLKFMLEL